ncbi:MAG: alpha-amylase [Thermaceae bacterium]|nr:alpha-amylase [Thermaceae bacterium]
MARLFAGTGAMEFHVAARARDHYQFDLALFSSSGNVVFADFGAARRFAAAMNAKRPPERAVSVGQVNAMGLIDEMLHVTVEAYRTQQNPRVMAEALAQLEVQLGPEALERTLRTFATEFPPLAVYRGEMTIEAYLTGQTEGRSHREIVLEEMLMLWMANANPAFAPFLELFDDAQLEQSTAYLPAIQALEHFFEGEPAFSGTGLSLFKTLRLPALQFPDSLEAQLEFLLTRLGGSLGRFIYRLLVGRDVLREEGRWFERAPTHLEAPGGFGGGDLSPEMFSPRAQRLEHEPEAFSPDLDWMPQLVLIAKNAFVWLDQLSKQYGREIQTLDQIPDAELDNLASWGVTGLWLIGLWERSRASKQIKQRMGNPDAVASAYSLYDYVIARDLGGEAALQNLKERAWRRGIRLASDMVPNHVGIDGRWVYEHPDWFISLPYPPYPNYRFSGPDLSEDPRVGIFLEDHYYDKSDAAVVFKRVDRWTGQERYIYHGNDGTLTPWNDTAQLDYLNPEVREAVIQTILHVARQFPVIRFDAAMTLAKRHIQRLWWPEPGGSPWGQSIPSRAEFAMTKEEFDRRMPVEFWREVVDRVAIEAPDTLLLAEAFWMMEGYFVRTLGMHRVYNSAFMNMLRDEKNAEYRKVLQETLEFDPEILKRYVNFLNNPDEKTALEQFGKGDKYFGVMTLCATLPGLPMLGHGQVEGYSERYGMEYRRAYYQELPDQGLIEHHREQIFPLLKRRHQFAGAQHFVLYDFDSEGGVNQDVFAYSNREGAERSLVVYHNRANPTKGWVRHSVAQPLGGSKELQRRSLDEGLGLSLKPHTYSLFRDRVRGLEFIRSNAELAEKGLYLELGPYGRQVFLDWREVYDADGSYARVAAMLGGQGVESVEEARYELVLEPIQTPFRELVNASVLRRLMEAARNPDPALLEDLQARLMRLQAGIAAHTGKTPPALELRERLAPLLRAAASPQSPVLWGALWVWSFAPALGEADQPRDRLEEWRLGRILEGAVRELGTSPAEASRAAGLAKLLMAQPGLLKGGLLALEGLGQDPEAQRYLGFNRFEGVTYFNREALELLLEALEVLGGARAKPGWSTWRAPVAGLAAKVGYQADAFLAQLRRMAKTAKKGGVGKTAKASQGRVRQTGATPKPSPQASRPNPKGSNRAPSTLDDLTRIAGVGPKTAAALRAAGITSFATLAQTREAELRKALLAAGLRTGLRLETWAKQARYLAKGDRAGLERYLKRLKE